MVANIMDFRHGKALYVYDTRVNLSKYANYFCLKNKLALEIWMKRRSQLEFLVKLTKVEYYLDLKGFTTKDIISVSGIQALMFGCKVFVDSGDIITDFTTTKYKDYIQLYRSLLA